MSTSGGRAASTRWSKSYRQPQQDHRRDGRVAALGRDRGLNPSETDYVARTRDRRRLRFSVTGEDAIERAYRTHWVSPELSERAVARQSRRPDLVVIMPVNDWSCASCGGSGDLMFLEDAGPLCLDCADLGHLVFLPSGDAALTRRAKRASRLSAVVVRWSRARKRYERQGILVEAEALERAENECLADAEVRARRRERDEARRANEDLRLQAEFGAAIRTLFPNCRRIGRPGRLAGGARPLSGRPRLGRGRVGRLWCRLDTRRGDGGAGGCRGAMAVAGMVGGGTGLGGAGRVDSWLRRRMSAAWSWSGSLSASWAARARSPALA